jgi:hypothetical protein
METQMRNLLALLLIVLACVKGQTSKDDAAAQAKKNELTNAASAGTPLPATINVSDKVNVEAVMLPRDVARRVFGKEVADNYAVIEVNISNRSNDAGLIVQSLFIDLHDWGLAGPMGFGIGPSGLNRASQSKPFQVKDSPLEVSSVEYRIVRGDLLDQQPWTKRNIGLRVIQVLGSVGTAFAFPFTKDVVAGIGAWNGAVVPGYQAMFPDGTQAQLDRISDYGFRNNKVIPQQAADILVAFFPIKRFLTPTLQQVFLNTPALFFNPALMVVDPATRRLLNPNLLNVFGTNENEEVDKQFKSLLEAYAALDQVALATTRQQLEVDLDDFAKDYAAKTQDQAAVDKDKRNSKADPAVADRNSKVLADDQNKLADDQKKLSNDKDTMAKLTEPLAKVHLYTFLSALSLNNVHVVLSGIMTVDVDNVPAIITSIGCDNDSQPALIWGDAGDRSCAIHGSFLSNGTPTIAEAATLGLTVGAVAASSNDGMLNMKITLTKQVPPNTVLTFQVNKKNKQGNTVESMKFPYTVPDCTLPAPSIHSVAVNGTVVTVAGANFYNTSASPLAVTAHPIPPSGLADQKIEKPTSTLTQIQFDDKAFGPACWQVQVKVGNAQAPESADKPPKDQFAVAPMPKIDAATLSGTKLTVTGEQFVDLAGCGVPLSFEVVSDAPGAKPQAIAKASISADDKQASFDVPVAPQGEKWLDVHALLNGKQVVTAKIITK